MSTRAKRAAGLLPMYERQASKYYDKHEKSGLHENIKDGYVGSTAKMDGMGELVDTLHNEDGGFYGEDAGEKTYIYKKAKQKEAPAQQAAAELEKPKEDMVIKDRGPVEYSPEMQQAKERTQKFVGAMDGNAGSTLNTSTPDASTAPAATAKKEAALAKIDTQAYNPNPGREEQAQETADKYKLNLINKGTGGQSNFSGV